jgi:hypothetical protein
VHAAMNVLVVITGNLEADLEEVWFKVKRAKPRLTQWIQTVVWPAIRHTRWNVRLTLKDV